MDVYDGILAYAKHLRSIRDVVANPERIDGFANALELHVGALLGIARDELAGRALTVEQKDYLSYVSEHERPRGYAVRRTPRLGR